jgi:hypothetical protein
MNILEAKAQWEADRPMLEAAGIYLTGVDSYTPKGFESNIDLAMDAQPALSTVPNAGIPSYLTMYVDPTIIEILFAPTKAAEIFGEVRRGTWEDQTAMFPVVEHTGEVASYGDYSENGVAGANTNFEQRQAYLFQTIMEWGELEESRAGRAKIAWANEIKKAAMSRLNRFSNKSYFFGIAGLQNFGLLNDPALSASLTPGPKAAGNGNVWTFNGGINATANEVYADIQALFLQLVSQTQGLVEKGDKLTLSLSPDSAVALTATNTFNVNVEDLLKKNFPRLEVKSAVQYGATSASNTEGLASNFVQLIADELEGQDTGYCAYNEKARMHRVVMKESSVRQKVTSGTFGSIIRMPIGISSMAGI